MEPPSTLRNICILAHVDHGKTTLADHLIAAAGGGVLHSRQAGKLRFMDYRDDEQQRAITMKSACIVLRFQDHVINLIDSPGHVDFCSEVSTAVRLSDGALILVDTCEGVHIQTHAVLRQAWLERLKPCLVLNKVDRLITELKLSPSEAYARMQSIIMEVNNIISAFRSEKYLSDVDSMLAGPTSVADDDMENDESEDDEDAFAPERGNVAFASAGDGWAFRLEQFAELYAAKLGANAIALKKALWGNHFFVPKTKKIVGKKAAAGKLKPMFVQFVLEPLWQVYDAAMQGKDGTEMLNKIIKSMNLVIPSRDLQHKDPKLVLQAVMSKWLPLSDTVLGMVVECLPDPASAMPERVERMLPKEELLSEARSKIEEGLESVRKAVEVCDSSSDAPCVVFVSKMVAVPIEMLPRHSANGELLSSLENQVSMGDIDAGGRECFLAFARVFSGVVSIGQKMYVLSALYDPSVDEVDGKHLQEATVQSLYLMMGRGLEPIHNASAGHLIAIGGLGQQILKSATLCSTRYSLPFASMRFQAAPIVRVAVEPSDPANMGVLAKGLRLLNRADPFVEVTISNSGEHVIAAAGEVHLERCIKDLKERFARIELEVSSPLVAFRETIEVEGGAASQSGIVQTVTPNGRCTIRVQVTRLPSAVTQVLDDSYDLLRGIIEGNEVASRPSSTSRKASLYPGEKSGDDPIAGLRNRLLAAFEIGTDIRGHENGNSRKEDAERWKKKLKRVWALGPRRVGPNMLFLPDDRTVLVKDGSSSVHSDAEDVALVKGYALVSERLGLVEKEEDRSSSSDLQSSLFKEVESLESSVISGFQLATAAGPLCEEPMWGLAFSVEVFVTTRERSNSDSTENTATSTDISAVSSTEQYSAGALSGQIMSGVKDACRAAVLAKNPRIAEALYFCEVSTPPEHLGQVYAVLGRRRARVLKEEMMDGSALFIVHAYMPVAESFGFAHELRQKTSGFASPQLVLSHWEHLSEDPFYVPKTIEEIEEFGDGSSVLQNTSRKLIDSVRRRKGLPVEEKIVQHATKQRTRSRKV